MIDFPKSFPKESSRRQDSRLLFFKWNKRSSYDMWRWLIDTKNEFTSLVIFLLEKFKFHFLNDPIFSLHFCCLKFWAISCIWLKSFVSEIWTWQSVFSSNGKLLTTKQLQITVKFKRFCNQKISLSFLHSNEKSDTFRM